MKGYENRADSLFRSKLKDIPQADGKEVMVNYLETGGKALLLEINVALAELARDYCKEKKFTYMQIQGVHTYNMKLLRHFFEFVKERMNLS